MQERSYSDKVFVAKENLLEIKGHLEDLGIISEAHLRELADVLALEYVDHFRVDKIIENFSLDSRERAILSMAISKALDLSVDLLPFDDVQSPPAEPMTAYFRNSISDLAFSIFSREIKDLRATYLDSLFACSEDVYSGTSDFCMLPILDYNDGDMWSVRRLIDKHELSIVMTLDLPTSSDESNFVRFALLSRELHAYKGADRLRVTALFNDASELSGFIDGCCELGATALTVSNLPRAFSDQVAFDIDFDVSSASTKALGIFFSLFYPRTTIGGIYRHLKTM